MYIPITLWNQLIRRLLTLALQACREFVNRNVVCKSASTKSPELLAKYADSLLRKSAKSAEEADLENKLTQIVSPSSSFSNSTVTDTSEDDCV